VPFFYLGCSKCNISEGRMLAPAEVAQQKCAKCGRPMRRQVRAPSVQVNEVIDNGIMPHAIERLADVEKLSRERSKTHRPNPL